jgi:hypothetical protein
MKRTISIIFIGITIAVLLALMYGCGGSSQQLSADQQNANATLASINQAYQQQTREAQQFAIRTQSEADARLTATSVKATADLLNAAAAMMVMNNQATLVAGSTLDARTQEAVLDQQYRATETAHAVVTQQYWEDEEKRLELQRARGSNFLKMLTPYIFIYGAVLAIGWTLYCFVPALADRVRYQVETPTVPLLPMPEPEVIAEEGEEEDLDSDFYKILHEGDVPGRVQRELLPILNAQWEEEADG